MRSLLQPQLSLSSIVLAGRDPDPCASGNLAHQGRTNSLPLCHGLAYR